MSVTIKRKTGTLGMGAKFSVKVNGEKVTTIAHEEAIELDIKDENASLRVSQFGSHSNQIQVKDGDVVEVTTTRLAYLAFLIPFIFIIVSNIIENVYYATNTFVLMVLLMLVILFTFNCYRLKVINRKTTRQSF
ncbi:hypothetical protein [Desemzia sp. FAM 23991]|uniref:hypothetical protein n=1 Tax=unclassified Desemzia TaxID=2685243 RepID=UPI003885C215